MAKILLLTKSKTDFFKFGSYDTSLRDEPRPGCLSNLKQNTLKDLVECNLCKSSWE